MNQAKEEEVKAEAPAGNAFSFMTGAAAPVAPAEQE